MKYVILSSLLLFFSTGVAQAKEIALSFDDAPRNSTMLLSGEKRTSLLVKSLKAAEVPQVVFFCNTERFDKQGSQRMRTYMDAGHLIANHSHSHPSLDKTPVDIYWNDILQADQILKNLSGFRKWFRFPFLHEGNTVDKRDEIRRRLREKDYAQGYVTVDTAEWYTDSLVQNKKAAGFQVDMEKLKKAYVQMLVDSIQFYDDLALKTIRRSPKHIILLHENDLAALFISDLVFELRRNGWKIISPEEAYQDPISLQEPDTMILNQGRIAAIARANGYTGSIWSKWEEETEIDKYLDEHQVFIGP